MIDENDDEAFFEQLGATLRRLTRLTTVLLRDILWQQGGLEGSVLAGLAELPRLQRLYWLSHQVGWVANPLPLPPGPYTACLRVLGTSIECLSRSTALLASCSAIEHVAVLFGDCDQSGPFWQWAAQHRSLQPAGGALRMDGMFCAAVQT